MSTATKVNYSVHGMTEGEWLVRGTQDPMKALQWVVGELDDLSEGIDVSSVRHNDDEDPLPESIAEAADWCYTMLANAKPGYYRRIHCLPNSNGAYEGWSWQIDYAKGPARGAFAGVYFRMAWA